MDIVNAVLSFVQFLILTTVALVALAIVLLIVISILPQANPLRMMLAALLRPVGIMVGAEVLAIPIEFIPGIDAIYDIAAVVFIGYAWVKFAREARYIWPHLARHFSSNLPGAGTPRRGAVEQSGLSRWFSRLVLQAKQGWDEGYNGRPRPKQEQAQNAGGQGPHAGAQEQQQEEAPRPRGGAMTRAEALEILELGEGATRDQIVSAYKRIMQNVHPDKGGSTFFAKQLNAARDVLTA